MSISVGPAASNGSLPTATGANEVPASTGAGTTYSAVTVPAILATVGTTRGDIFVRDASTVTRLALGSAGKVLRSDGTDLAYTTATFPNTSTRGAILIASAANVWSAYAVGSAGKILRSDGTDALWTTLTLPNTAARGTLLAATATDTVTALVANTADTFVGGDGTDVTTRTAAQARASILGPYSDAMTGSGWVATATSGGGTATWGSSKLTLDYPLGSAASAGSEKSSYLPSGEWYDLAIRLDVTAGDGSTATRVGFTTGQSTANVSILIWSDGTVEWGSYGGGSYTALGTTAGPNSGQRTGGQLWLRITRTPVSVAYMWGVGAAGALPVEWTTVAISSSTTVVARGSGQRVELFGLTTSSFAFTVEILAVKAALPGGF